MDQYAKHNLDNDGEPYKVAYEQANERWEVALTVSEKGFQQISFVNSIATTKVSYSVEIFFRRFLCFKCFSNSVIHGFKISFFFSFLMIKNKFGKISVLNEG